LNATKCLHPLLGLLLALIFQTCSLAANPTFYALDIRANNDALLHGTQESVDQTQKLPLTLLGGEESTCCFVFGAQSKGKGTPGLKVNNEQPLLSSSHGDEAYQFLGAYRPAVAEKAANKLGFGFNGMRQAKLVAQRTYEVTFADASPPIFVQHCLGSEGVNFKLYHALNDKKPFIKYYFALGYEVKADCPAKP
jgi:hypothetical protein